MNKAISWFKLFDKFVEKNKNKVHEPKVQIPTIGYTHRVEYIQSVEIEAPNNETLINIEPTLKGECTVTFPNRYPLVEGEPDNSQYPNYTPPEDKDFEWPETLNANIKFDNNESKETYKANLKGEQP